MYYYMVMVEGKFDNDLHTLTSTNFLPWNPDLPLPRRLQLLSEICGVDPSLWKAGDPWGSPLNFCYHGDASTNRQEFGTLHSLVKRLRIWSNGPNRRNEDGKGDDICAPENWFAARGEW
jgi:hypothetical protein